MKKTCFILIAILFALSVNGQVSYLQYRHVPVDQDAKFLERETQYWAKVAKSAIDKGQMTSWTLWKKVGTTSADELTPNYVFVNTFENLDQMDLNKVWSDNMDALGDVKSEDIETRSFTTTTFDYFVQSEDYIDGEFKFALVNYAKPTDLASFIEENKTLWRPFHEARINDIIDSMTYWGMSSVIYPQGNQDRFSIFTVDGFNKLQDALDYLRFTETSVNSPNAAAWNDLLDKTKMDELVPNGFERRIIYERILTVD